MEKQDTNIVQIRAVVKRNVLIGQKSNIGMCLSTGEIVSGGFSRGKWKSIVSVTVIGMNALDALS